MLAQERLSSLALLSFANDLMRHLRTLHFAIVKSCNVDTIEHCLGENFKVIVKRRPTILLLTIHFMCVSVSVSLSLSRPTRVLTFSLRD